MVNLGTKYLGLNLKNPLIISSSGLTNSVEKISNLEEKGAAAVILKSIFEEQIRYESNSLDMGSDYPEATDYILNYTKSNNIRNYLDLIEQSKKVVKIPVIPSINCMTSNEWVSFAKNLESAGADAVELNIYFLPTDKNTTSAEYESNYLDVINNVLSEIKIPIAVKLGNGFTNPAYIVNQLYKYGVKGVVLFNRFYEPDIDIDNLKLTTAEILSNNSDIRQSLRWIGLISSMDIKIDIAASTGVHDSEGLIKMLLAGANSVMICSALYKYGTDHIKKIIKGLEEWMVKKNYNSIDEFRGKMNYNNIPDPSLYERSQFMKYFSSIQ